MIFRHRRLLCISLFAILAVFVAELLPHTYKGAFFWVALICALLSFGLCFWKRRFIALTFALLLAALSFLSSYQVSYGREAAASLENTVTELSVTVTETTGKSDDIFLANGTLSILFEGKQISLSVKVKAKEEIKIGDVLFGNARFTATTADSYYAAEGFYGTVSYLDGHRTVDRLSSPTLWLNSFKAKIAERLSSALPDEGGALLSALLLGVREGLSDSFTRDMSRIGTSHMLSLSGMHLVILSAGIALLLKKVRLGRHLRTLLLSLFVIFFMFLTGLSSSVLRAGFMFLFSALPFFLREERDSLSSLTAAVALILIWEPYAVRDLSLWLSALATLGLLLIFDRKKRDSYTPPSVWRSVLDFCVFSLTMTLAATVATLPLTLCIFGQLPLLSPVANLILSPLVQVALYLALILAFLGGVPVLTPIASFICKLIFSISSVLADIPRTSLTLTSPASLGLVFVFFALILLLFLFAPRRRGFFRAPIALCVCFAVLLCAFEGFSRLSHVKDLSVSYFATEKDEGDALLFTYRGERLMTVFSDFSYFRAAEREALASSAGELDGFLLPYYTEDSAAYVTSLLETQKIYSLYLPAPRTAREMATYEAILAKAEKEGVSITPFDANEAFFFGSLTVSRLHLGAGGEKPSFIFLEFLFGYSSIQYYSANAQGFSMQSTSLDAELLIFGTYGGAPHNRFSREDFVSPEAHVLCASPAYFPFTELEDIAFSQNGCAFLPMITAHP